MNEQDLESTLVTWGQEKITPPAELLQRVRARRHQDPWLPWMLGISLIAQIITVSGGFWC